MGASRYRMLVPALALERAAAAEGRCVACAGGLPAFAPARGRDARRDEDAFFLDRFCSHACYHAFGRRVTSLSARAAWN